MASLNAVVSTGDRPAALALSGIICQSTEWQRTCLSASFVSAVDIRDKGISGGANFTAVSSDIFISVGADCAAGSSRVGG